MEVHNTLPIAGTMMPDKQKLLFRRLRHQFAKAAIGTLADVDNVFL